MSQQIDPSLNRRRLRIALHKARKDRGLTQKQAAELLEWSLSKLIRIEAGTVSVSVTDLNAMLGEYAIEDPALVQELKTAARGSKGPSWWTAYNDLINPQYAQYLGYETAASSFRIYHPLVVPALLQTEDYATALLAPQSPAEKVRRAVELRSERQERLLEGEDGPELHLVLDEGALRRVIGGGSVMAAQLSRVRELATAHPRVTVRVLPYDAGAHFSTTTSFILLGFADDVDDLLYLEGAAGALSSRDDGELIAPYQECFEDISGRAYEGEKAVALLDRVVHDMNDG